MKPPFEKKEITYRKLRSIDRLALHDDILKSRLMTTDRLSLSASELVVLYNSELSTILERLAPLKKRIVTLRPAAPWYSDDIRKAKSIRRKLERKWRSTRLTIDREIYVRQCDTVNPLISSSKENYYSSIIADNKSDPKVLFSCFDRMLNRGKLESCCPGLMTQVNLLINLRTFFLRKYREYVPV